MNYLIFALVFLVGSHSVASLPRYLVIPLAEDEVIELSPRIYAEPPHVRITRRAEAFVPVALAKVNDDEVEPTLRMEQASAHVLDYVDFGGHTGTNGAFGWYADFPAHR